MIDDGAVTGPTAGASSGGVPAPAESPDLVALTRQDVAAMLAAYRAETSGARQWRGVVTGIGGLLAGVVLLSLRETFHWPEALDPVFFFGGWSVMVVSFFVTVRRERQLRDRYHVECPACGETLFDRRSAQRSIARSELAIATGNCPSCGAHFLAEDGDQKP